MPLGGDPGKSEYSSRARATGGRVGGVFASQPNSYSISGKISADASYDSKYASENNKLGKYFKGLTISTTLSETGSPDTWSSGGWVSLPIGGETYEAPLRLTKTSHYASPNTQYRDVNIFIPASRIGIQNYLSEISVRAGTTNQSIMFIEPIKHNINLQTRPTLRQGTK